MENSSRFFLKSVIKGLSSEIRKNNGNELFAIGKLKKGVVCDFKVVARGNENMVSAILDLPESGDVVVHNHPSGNLTPSDNDIYIATLLGNNGVGFYIVDNDVERVNVVVEVREEKEISEIRDEELEQIFSKSGILSRKLKDYEFRKDQLRMSKIVASSFKNGNISLIEAPTGIGKSFAYLVPSVLFSLKNNVKVVISTKSINLQEQLIYKDIPFLREILPSFKAVILKGRRNYLCLRRFKLLEDGASLFEGELREEFLKIKEWKENTEDGSLGDLSFMPSSDLWQQICSQVETCKGVKCEFYKECFFFRMKWKGNSADIIIVNHHLLMADLKLKAERSPTTVLPSVKYLVLDESHKLEEAASSFLSMGSSERSFTYNVGFLQNFKNPVYGLIPSLSNKLRELYGKVNEGNLKDMAELNRYIEETFYSLRKSFNEKLEKLFGDIRGGIKKILKKGESKLRITEELLKSEVYVREVVPPIKEVIDEVNLLVDVVKSIHRRVSLFDFEIPPEIEDILMEINGVILRILEHIQNLFPFIDGEYLEDGICNWVEVGKSSGKERVVFYSSPVYVGDFLKNHLFMRFNSVILTSATLCVDNSFDFIRERIGLVDIQTKNVTEYILPPYFNYRENVYFSVLNFLPNPSDFDFLEYFNDFLERFFQKIKVGTFILFTSYKWLNYSFEYLRDVLVDLNMLPLKQGAIPRRNLIEKFKRKKNGVLFGTDSFWEGVDVKGDALSCIIIPKLPFLVPTEPLQEAKFEHIKNMGKNPFMDYSLPMAILKLKQGCGRLIRSKEDRGIILICDRRMLTRDYGKKFINSLPDMDLKVFNGEEDLLREVTQWWGSKK